MCNTLHSLFYNNFTVYVTHRNFLKKMQQKFLINKYRLVKFQKEERQFIVPGHLVTSTLDGEEPSATICRTGCLPPKLLRKR